MWPTTSGDIFITMQLVLCNFAVFRPTTRFINRDAMTTTAAGVQLTDTIVVDPFIIVVDSNEYSSTRCQLLDWANGAWLPPITRADDTVAVLVARLMSAVAGRPRTTVARPKAVRVGQDDVTHHNMAAGFAIQIQVLTFTRLRVFRWNSRTSK